MGLAVSGGRGRRAARSVPTPARLSDANAPDDPRGDPRLAAPPPQLGPAEAARSVAPRRARPSVAGREHGGTAVEAGGPGAPASPASPPGTQRAARERDGPTE